MHALVTGLPPYMFAVGAITCFGLTILFAFKDKMKAASLLGGLFFLCTLLAYFPQLDSIAAFSINVKLRQNLDRAEEILTKLQEERTARVNTETAMLAQLKWRGDVTPDAMRAFVAILKERKTDIDELTIFTLMADPEANDFGNTILYAMKEAGVNFRWGRIPTVMDVTEVTVSTIGLTLYKNTKCQDV